MLTHFLNIKVKIKHGKGLAGGEEWEQVTSYGRVIDGIRIQYHLTILSKLFSMSGSINKLVN